MPYKYTVVHDLHSIGLMACSPVFLELGDRQSMVRGRFSLLKGLVLKAKGQGHCGEYRPDHLNQGLCAASQPNLPEHKDINRSKLELLEKHNAMAFRGQGFFLTSALKFH